MKGFQLMKYLQQLKSIRTGKEGFIDRKKFEDDFIQFSSYLPHQELTVRAPKLYVFGDEKQRQLQEALTAMEVNEKSSNGG